MKSLKSLAVVLLVASSTVLAPNTSRAESYEEYLRRLDKEMKESGMSIDAFAQNPFQTGTALSGYYLNEKTLLLERDAFFQMKSNDLETTEDVADYHHRLRVLRSHGNNILLQLIQAVEQRNKEGFVAVEAPKQKVELEKLVEECNKDSQCVAERLQNPETSIQNILVDNFALATQIFQQVPYMHVLEVNSIYQLVQLIYLEVLYSQNLLSTVEFDIFLKKQEELEKLIRRNKNLTPSERKLHTEMIKNQVNKWKKRILERRFDHRDEFKAKALKLNDANRRLYAQIVKLRQGNKEIFGDIYKKVDDCVGNILEIKRWRWCAAKNKLIEKIQKMGSGRYEFLEEKETKMPKDFWDELG